MCVNIFTDVGFRRRIKGWEPLWHVYFVEALYYFYISTNRNVYTGVVIFIQITYYTTTAIHVIISAKQEDDYCAHEKSVYSYNGITPSGSLDRWNLIPEENPPPPRYRNEQCHSICYYYESWRSDQVRTDSQPAAQLYSLI